MTTTLTTTHTFPPQAVVLIAQPRDDDISAPEEVAFRAAEDALVEVDVAANDMRGVDPNVFLCVICLKEHQEEECRNFKACKAAYARMIGYNWCGYCNSKPREQQNNCRNQCILIFELFDTAGR